ncbi:MAG: MerC family mercury resistance protein [Sedimentisphaerales bacterium]|nr:MerC family mercury resistance protein [Sedimentisphaerales bacterium]
MKTLNLGFIDKIGSIGSLLAAAVCPACFPMWAVVGSALGLGILHPFEGKVFIVFQLLVAVALVGSIISYFNHRKVLPLLTGTISPALIFFGLYVFFHPVIVYSGLFGLAVGSIMNLIANRRCKRCNLEAETDETKVHN